MRSMTDGTTSVGEALERYVPETWDDRLNDRRGCQEDRPLDRHNPRVLWAGDAARQHRTPSEGRRFFRPAERQPIIQQARYPGLIGGGRPCRRERRSQDPRIPNSRRYRRNRSVLLVSVAGRYVEGPAFCCEGRRRKPGDEGKRVPFQIDDLRRMFSARLYVGRLEHGHGFNCPERRSRDEVGSAPLPVCSPGHERENSANCASETRFEPRMARTISKSTKRRRRGDAGEDRKRRPGCTCPRRAYPTGLLEFVNEKRRAVRNEPVPGDVGRRQSAQ